MNIDDIKINMQGTMDFPMPKMMKVRQNFKCTKINDIRKTVREELKKIENEPFEGKRIAITAGSRKIANLPIILNEVVKFLKEKKAKPFIVPAMGSHAGASAEGQKNFLIGLGITEEAVGAPIVSSMDTIALGTINDESYTVYCDKNAFEADGIIVCGRIKPHTSIKGIVESGLCKMMVVGLGKHKGATSFHRQGYFNLAKILPEGGKVFLEKAKVICGLGIVENAYDETAIIEVVKRDHFIERESELLLLAKEMMPRFLLDEIDVLIIDQFGKEISGAGIDPNITGRAITPLPVKAPINIGFIVALHLTEASHGNALGIGGSEFITRHVLDQIDFSQMYTNVLTSSAVRAAQIPLIAKDDEEAIRCALKVSPRQSIDDVKVVHILDTLHMGEILISENYKNYINSNPDFEIIEENVGWKFESGRLEPAIK